MASVRTAVNGYGSVIDNLAVYTVAYKRARIKLLAYGFQRLYYIEVTNTHKSKVPGEWIRKQTLVNAERYITQELKDYEEKNMDMPSYVEVPRPSSSNSIRLRSLMLLSIEAASFISTINVDSPSDILSLAPTRVNTLSTTPMRALSART